MERVAHIKTFAKMCSCHLFLYWVAVAVKKILTASEKFNWMPHVLQYLELCVIKQECTGEFVSIHPSNYLF